jgi:polynucleotide 5'-hydroxyl-kinase GRC3/NOL9
MLSAIAARKARLHLENIPSQEETSKKRKSSPNVLPNPSPPARRRNRRPAVNSPAKRTRKNTPKSHAGRNYDATTTVAQVSKSFTSREEDTTPLDYSDDDSDMSITLEQEDSTSIQHEHPPEPTRRGHTKAWSPSCLAVDSSDDASDASEQPLTDLSQLFPYNRTLTSQEPEILSTFRPTLDRNTFLLTLDERSSLGLNGPAVALILSPSTTVSFVGAYRLRVLRGSISLLGTTIQTSRVLHHVFAPWSSPIPVIEAHVAHGESSKSFSDIPARITSTLNEDGVVIVLQELQTGIEGLGHVVRTFEGVFDRANHEGALDIPLGGIHLVCHSFSEDASIPSHRISGIPNRPWFACL